tara:strand:+ start:712 stop:978 length:267 start_codon:yes stop_codon:yes gene_type:complete
MEAKDLVRRQTDDNDRRAKRVYLTAEVEPSVQTMRTIAAEMRRDALFGLSRSDREQFVDSLITIKENLARLNESASSKPATPKGGTSR